MTASTVLSTVNAGIAALTPIIDIADPAAGATMTMLSTVLNGLSILEPNAVALWNQISSGTPATVEQLQAAETACHAALAQLDADITAKLSATAS